MVIYIQQNIIIDFKNIQAEVHLSDLAGSQRLQTFFFLEC